MERRLRKEGNLSSSESHNEDVASGEKVSQKPVKEEGKKSRGKQRRRSSEGLGGQQQPPPKHSRIRELLNSFQDDVVQIQESEIGSREVTTDIIPIPASDQVEYSRQFTQLSPRKLSAKHSKWKRAVRLSKSVMSMNRARQQASSSATPTATQDVEKAKEELDGRGSNRKNMVGFLRVLDHGSCIASGILVGLLLWTTINVASWNRKSVDIVYSENYIKVYYTTTVILTYVTLLGFLIRIYSSWTRFRSLILLYALAFFSLLIFHYLTKGYSLLQVECQIYNRLDNETKSLISSAYNCPPASHPQPTDKDVILPQDELIFLTISNAVQTLGAFIISLYFHFTSFVEPWLSPGYKIESRRIMRS